MTRLATVLAGALVKSGMLMDEQDARECAPLIVAAIPEAQREAMEAALDVCTFDGLPFPCPMRGSAHGSEDHPYQPLVPLGDPS